MSWFLKHFLSWIAVVTVHWKGSKGFYPLTLQFSQPTRQSAPLIWCVFPKKRCSFSPVSVAPDVVGCRALTRVGAQTSRERVMLGCVEIAGATTWMFYFSGKTWLCRALHWKKIDQLVCVCACVCLCMYSVIPALSSRLSDLIFSNATGGL